MKSKIKTKSNENGSSFGIGQNFDSGRSLVVSANVNKILLSFYLFFLKTDKLKHKCTKVENPGEGIPEVFAKIRKGGAGGQGFHEKLPEGFLYFGYYCFFLTSVFKFAWGVLYFPFFVTEMPSEGLEMMAIDGGNNTLYTF
jgi:hypothetical protein